MRKAAFVLLAALAPLASAAAETDWKGSEAALGRPAMAQPDGVRRFGSPRSDLAVQVDGIAVRPVLGRGSRLAFAEHGGMAEVMGDLVLTQPEVNPALRRLHAGGLSATALHNHLLRGTPATMYMHVHGQGEPVALARALRTALEASATLLDRIIGAAGKVNGGVWQAVLPRPERITEAGMPTPASLGTGMAINVEPLEAGRVAAAGDLVLLANEIEPVQRALAEHGIEVTALHNHTLREEPRLFYMHFWAVGPAEAVATGLRAALDRTAVKHG
jgi:hypothetical protein